MAGDRSPWVRNRWCSVDASADEQLQALRDAGIGPTACSANVEQYGVASEMAQRPVSLVAAGAGVEAFSREGFTVLTF